MLCTHVYLRVPVQAREFFRGAARMAEGKQAGIHLISANNMTRRLDVTLAIIEYQVHAYIYIYICVCVCVCKRLDVTLAIIEYQVLTYMYILVCVCV